MKIKRFAPKVAPAPKRVRPAIKPVKRQGGGNNGLAVPVKVFAVQAVAHNAKEVKAKKAVDAKKVKLAKEKAAKKAQGRVIQVQPKVIRCGVGIVANPFQQATLNLPCGKGICHARLFLEFKKDPTKTKYEHPHWTGKIVSKTVEFEVAEYATIIDRRGK